MSQSLTHLGSRLDLLRRDGASCSPGEPGVLAAGITAGRLISKGPPPARAGYSATAPDARDMARAARSQCLRIDSSPVSAAEPAPAPDSTVRRS
ncbi:MAG: hypothetical protein CME06_13215 [Gemmatimonadetes bacterium]|nr:hypothetical protein [Gemmatimonadota bacterium]